MGDRRGRIPLREPGVPTAILGGLLLALTAAHVVLEPETDLFARVEHLLIPAAVILSTFVLSVDHHRRGEPDLIIARWGLAGALLGNLIYLWVYLITPSTVATTATAVMLSANATAVAAGSGLVVGYLATETARQRERIQAQNDRLDQFASIVSHDLRNPLTVARGYTELAREEVGDHDHFDRVIRAHDRMETIIDQMLALARTGDFETERVPLATVAEEAATSVPPGLDLHVESEQTVDASIPHLRSLFENLYRNAVEHGSKTMLQVGTDGNAVDGGRPVVTVTVGDLENGFYLEDDGPGIPADRREEVFTSGHTTGEGAGLGLSIVAQVAESHGWTPSVHEGDDGGARFEFRW
ncbi:sensor histidine kinase [Natronomonas sp. EA1]|uniref:sensor histidine kinase n=1 Tax=Natronomonas sp. EA1 TaxID=3421655 RepID=UPI003EBCAB6F